MHFDTLSAILARHDGRLKSLCRAGFVVCILTVCVLSLLPEDDLPDVALSDKIHHLIAYSAIAAFGLLGYRGPRAWVAVALGVIALGGALEIGQMYVPGRSSDWLDFAFNIAGVALGFILARLALIAWPAAESRAPETAGRPS